MTTIKMFTEIKFPKIRRILIGYRDITNKKEYHGSLQLDTPHHTRRNGLWSRIMYIDSNRVDEYVYYL